MSVPRWLKGDAWASPSGLYVRVGIEGRAGFRGEVYVTRKKARELRDALDRILSRPAGES